MKNLLLLLITFVSLTAQAQTGQYNYDYSHLYFDELNVPVGETANDDYYLAAIALSNQRFLKRNDDLTREGIFLEMTEDRQGGPKVLYKMTDEYARSIQNDMTEAPRNASEGDPEWQQSPEIRNYGPFQFTFATLSRRGNEGRYRLSVNKLPRTWRLRFQRSNNNGATWTTYNGVFHPQNGWVNNLPTNGYDHTNRRHDGRWWPIQRMRVLVVDENGVERQRTREISW